MLWFWWFRGHALGINNLYRVCNFFLILFAFFLILPKGAAVSDHRSKDQTLIAVPISKQFLAEIDSVRGDQSRSAYVRAALLEKLEKVKGSLPKELSYAPSRAGKGGKPTHKPSEKSKAKTA